MANEKEVKEILARVANEISRESELQGGTFRVADLSSQLSNLAKGGDAAWTISYSTASVADLKPGFRGGEVAWSISYSTSSAAALQGIKETAK
jgi:hypothetical protein